jgi:hypothetical protein
VFTAESVEKLRPTQYSAVFEKFTSDFAPVLLYGYETWSLTIREEHRLRMSENKVLRTIFEPKICRGLENTA